MNTIGEYFVTLVSAMARRVAASEALALAQEEARQSALNQQSSEESLKGALSRRSDPSRAVLVRYQGEPHVLTVVDGEISLLPLDTEDTEIPTPTPAPEPVPA